MFYSWWSNSCIYNSSYQLRGHGTSLVTAILFIVRPLVRNNEKLYKNLKY